MTKIYDQHDAAFKNVQAYVILRDGVPVAKIAFKFPSDGAGRLYAYVQWFGIEMVRGVANGYGYDKRSAAVESAVAAAIKQHKREVSDDIEPAKFFGPLTRIGGSTWDRVLQDAGFTAVQAV